MSELDIASQGASIEEARANLVEALTLFFETASPSEVSRRFQSEVFITQSRCLLGRLRVLSGSEICQILEQHDFVLARQRGSHRIMQKHLEAPRGVANLSTFAARGTALLRLSHSVIGVRSLEEIEEPSLGLF